MDIKLEILSLTDNFVAVNKPPGLSVHNEQEGPNLLQSLEQQLNRRELYPVHRLDKETSGVQIVALNKLAAQELAHQFQERSVIKRYCGVLRGVIKKDTGIWDQPLTDKAEGRTDPAGASKARIPCRTDFSVKQKNQFFSLCEFLLHTGRQHQIRKHTAIAGHAIVGDPRYGDRTYNQKMEKIYQVDRLFLHCSELEFAHYKINALQPREFAQLMGVP